MRSILLSILFFADLFYLNAQSPDYFQQKVDFQIDSKLNDENHTIQAHVKITYKNNSRVALDKIGMHLWPNAYKNKNTAFAKQKLLHRSSKFYDSNYSDAGYIILNNLRVQSKSAKLKPVDKNPDMAWLELQELLKPGQSIVIETDFELKIPASFSRLGHIDQSYQITQWYPKPAVFDHKGWHLMPYLDQGEFFADWGSYDVSISLPENYIVAATGELKDESEIKFLEDRIRISDQQIKSEVAIQQTPESSLKFKTLHYHADSVHDFAWFADKTFLVQKSIAELKAGKKIDCWAYFNSLKYWPNAANFVAKSVEFYSANLGEYPWPQATAVNSALSAGGGMEYPMITVINDVSSQKELDEVVCHEVGHNWLQGILATNERDHPWMDEGINSYYEHRYIHSRYKELSVLKRYGGRIAKKINVKSETELLYQIVAHLNFDQYQNQTSENFSYLNYGYDVYQRTSELFQYLEDYLGKDEFDRIMKIYFEKWKFKHPYPEDLKDIFDKNSSKNTEWLFRDILNSNQKIDYKISKLKNDHDDYQLTIKNKSKIEAPLLLRAYQTDSIYRDQWLDGFSKSRNIEIKDGQIKKFVIDPDGNYFDYNKSNNTIRTTGLLKKIEPLSLRLSNIYKDPTRSSILWYPSLLWNANNGWMLGLSFSKAILPTPKWNIRISPKYAFKSKSLAGSGEISFRQNFSRGVLNHLKIGISDKTYAYGINEINNKTNSYNQIRPYILFDFKTNLAKMITSKLSYEFFYIQDNFQAKSIVDSSFSNATATNQVHKMKYYYSIPSLLGPFNFKSEMYYEKYDLSTAQKANYVRMDVEINKSFRWKKRRYFDCRIASSFFPVNSERNRNSIASRNDQHFIRGSAGAMFQGFLDYTNESNFLGRTSSTGLWSQQVDIRQGGLKVAPGISQRTNLGHTNSFLLAANFSTDLPLPKIVGKLIRPYFDIAYVQSVSNQQTEFSTLYSGGIQLKLVPEFLSIYFPIFHSQNIKDIYRDNGGNYFKQVCFSLKLNFEHIKDLSNFIQ